jgi:hypothetical protein
VIRRIVIARAVTAGVALAILLPGIALGHTLNAAYTSRLPLAVYLAGAAMTVALSFAFVILRDVRVELPEVQDPGGFPPAWLRYGLRALGLFGWAWIMAQGIAGGSSSANVATLFLWVYGWVGIALISALFFPIWQWLDPFSTLYDIGAWVVRRLGITPWEPSEYPERLVQWPAVIGFAFFIWLELGLDQGEPSTLFIVLAGYTALTLAMMAQFGRDTWRANAETFTVWFRLLNRLAPLALADEDGRVRRRSFAAGLLEVNWTVAEIVMVALGVGSILFDGLSQTQIYYDLFGFTEVPLKTVLLFAFLGIVVAAALLLVRVLGTNPSGAGLLPIAAGYLIAHYLTYLLISGQLIVVALSDPFQRGWNIFGTLFYEPSSMWLPPGLVWTLQLAAVVGGHMVGAWAGHAAAVAATPPGTPIRTVRLRQLPLAIVMVALTTLTLWSLGQDLVITPEQQQEQATAEAPLHARYQPG